MQFSLWKSCFLMRFCQEKITNSSFPEISYVKVLHMRSFSGWLYVNMFTYEERFQKTMLLLVFPGFRTSYPGRLRCFDSILLWLGALESWYPKLYEKKVWEKNIFFFVEKIYFEKNISEIFSNSLYTRNSPAGQGGAEGKGTMTMSCWVSILIKFTLIQKQFRSFSRAHAPRVGLTS